MLISFTGREELGDKGLYLSHLFITSSSGHTSGVQRKLLECMVLVRPGFWALETAQEEELPLKPCSSLMGRHSNGPCGPVTTPQDKGPFFSSKEKLNNPRVFQIAPFSSVKGILGWGGWRESKGEKQKSAWSANRTLPQPEGTPPPSVLSK